MKSQSRRDFFKLLGLGGATLLASSVPAMGSEKGGANNGALGMLYDATMCVGCTRRGPSSAGGSA